MFKSIGPFTCDTCAETCECFEIPGMGKSCARCYADALGHGSEVSESGADDLFRESFGREMNASERRDFNAYSR